MFPLGWMPSVAWLPLGKASVLPDLNREKGQGAKQKGSCRLPPAPARGKRAAREAQVILCGPSPRARWAHTQAPSLTPRPDPPGKRTRGPCCLLYQVLERKL